MAARDTREWVPVPRGLGLQSPTVGGAVELEVHRPKQRCDASLISPLRRVIVLSRDGILVPVLGAAPTWPQPMRPHFRIVGSIQMSGSHFPDQCRLARHRSWTGSQPYRS